MKLKLYGFECEFENNDAKIFVPLFISLISWNIFDQKLNIILLILYFIFHLFIFDIILNFCNTLNYMYKKHKNKLKYPECKNCDVILQGYSPTKFSDENYAYYYCTKCNISSILIENDDVRKLVS